MATTVMAAFQGRSFGFGALLRRAFVCAVAAVGVSSTAWAVEDPSLTAAEYEALGVPAADRTWGATEYEAAALALTKLAISSPERLPRRGSSKSGAVFERIVATSNLTAIATASLPLEDRVSTALGLMSSQLAILEVYRVLAVEMTGAEVVDLFGYELRTATTITLLVQEYFWELSPLDPRRYALIAAYARMRANLTKILAPVLQVLVDGSNYQAPDRLRLASTVEELWPALFPLVPEGARKELPDALRRLIAGDSEPVLKEVLSRVLAKSGAS